MLNVWYMTLLKFTKWLREGCIVSSTKIIIQVQAYFQGSTIHVLLLLEIPAYFFCVYFIHIRLIFQNQINLNLLHIFLF